MHRLQTTRPRSKTASAWYWLPLALALSCWTNTSSAAEYAIQVGAFTSPSQAYAETLRSFGEVNTTRSSSGTTVFTVGRYNSVDEAKEDLNRIATAYPGAFVRNMPAAAESVDLASNTSSPHSSNQPSSKNAYKSKAATQQKSKAPDTQLWESLSESERRRVVYLDGVLHLKQGDQFVPLADYRRSQQQ